METFLILLAGGIMLAAAISDPKAVTLQWLRLAGILALALSGLALFFFLRRGIADAPVIFTRTQVGLWSFTLLSILLQLAFVQVARRRTQRAFAAIAVIGAILAASGILHELMVDRGSAVQFPPKFLSMVLQAVSCAGVAAMTGLALMDMLLGHAYLTASKMTMAPFRRLNLALIATLVLRIITAVGAVLLLHGWRPVPMLWGLHGIYIGTRWFVGLLIPAIFLYMAHDCIKRRSTQSATGILYVAGVLIFIGEIVALHLVRETGLPF